MKMSHSVTRPLIKTLEESRRGMSNAPVTSLICWWEHILLCMLSQWLIKHQLHEDESNCKCDLTPSRRTNHCAYHLQTDDLATLWSAGADWKLRVRKVFFTANTCFSCAARPRCTLLQVHNTRCALLLSGGSQRPHAETEEMLLLQQVSDDSDEEKWHQAVRSSTFSSLPVVLTKHLQSWQEGCKHAGAANKGSSSISKGLRVKSSRVNFIRTVQTKARSETKEGRSSGLAGSHGYTFTCSVQYAWVRFLSCPTL